jgi:hypothetical protein
MEVTTSIDAVRGMLNVYDLDANIPIGGADVLSFKAYHKKGGNPVISKTRAQMTITDAAQGQYQVVLDPTDTTAAYSAITVTNIFGEVVYPRSLYYEATIDVGGAGKPQLVASGVMYLVG